MGKSPWIRESRGASNFHGTVEAGNTTGSRKCWRRKWSANVFGNGGKKRGGFSFRGNQSRRKTFYIL